MGIKGIEAIKPNVLNLFGASEAHSGEAKAFTLSGGLVAA